MPEVNIENLRYPFYRNDPRWLFSKMRWKLNEWKDHWLPLLNLLRCRLTVVDMFGAPGDAIITATVIRNIKANYPKLKINCITGHPGLLKLDPHIDTLSKSETFFSILSWYLDIRMTKDGSTNIVKPTLAKLGIKSFDYKAQFFLSPEEKQAGKERIQGLKKPIITMNCLSKEPVKNWPLELWSKLVEKIKDKATILQLGGGKEPQFPRVKRFAGRLTLRESAAVLANADLHIGPDSFLIHAANGLDIPAVVIFGGSRTPGNTGYKENKNIYVKTDCSPCWIHNTEDEQCPHDTKCMKMITPEMVYREVLKALNQKL